MSEPIQANPQARLDALILPSAARAQIDRIVAALQSPTSAGAPTAVLLTGAPGTGKTEVARALAEAVPDRFAFASAGDLRGQFIGDAENSLKDAFQRARARAPSVLFVDEIDAVARARGTPGADVFSEEVVTQFLVEMDANARAPLPVILLGAANSPEHIDPALRMRFLTIDLPLPDLDARRELLRRRIAATSRKAGLDVDAVAAECASLLEGFSGRDLDAIVRGAVERSAAAARSPEDIGLTRATLVAEAQERVAARRHQLDGKAREATRSDRPAPTPSAPSPNDIRAQLLAGLRPPEESLVERIRAFLRRLMDNRS